MNRTRKSIAAAAAGMIAAPALVLAAAPAHADGPEKEKQFGFAGAWVEFQVEKERNYFDIDVDIDDAKPGSKWRLVLRHDGKVVHDKTYTADREGEVEFSKWRKNTKGKDKFKLTVRKVGGPKRYSKIVFAR